MSTTQAPRKPSDNPCGPAESLTDPMLAAATRIIKEAIEDHCQGSDLWLCSAVAAQKILGGIAQESVHRYTNCEPGPWKRMPPALRAAIAKATGAPE